MARRVRAAFARDGYDGKSLIRPHRSSGVRHQIERDSGGADGLARNVGQGVVDELLVCVPPPPGQPRILEYLTDEAGRIHAVSQRCRDGVARLREYRMAPISAAVTGQIDVRGEV